MHPLFYDWYSAIDLKPDEETLKKRWQGVEKICKKMNLQFWLNLVRIHFHSEDGDSTAFANEFKTLDATFPMTENSAELALLAATCVVQLLADTSIRGDVVALGVVSTNCHQKGPSNSWIDTVDVARHYLRNRSQKLRKIGARETGPISVPELIEIPEAPECPQAENWPTTHQNFADITSSMNDSRNALNRNFSEIAKFLEQSATKSVLKRLEVLQEETNVLWWLFGEYSRDLDCPIRELKIPAICMLASKELSDLVHLIPGPPAFRSVINKVFQLSEQEIPGTVRLDECVNATPREWREDFKGTLVSEALSDVTPVLFAIEKSVEVKTGKKWQPLFEAGSGLKPGVALSPMDMSEQIYEEIGFLKLAQKLS